MQRKVIQTPNTNKNKDKNDSKKTITIINKILTNNSEISKHKSLELYTQYSPSDITNTNNNNNIETNKKNTTLANTIKQIIHYSGVKKLNNIKNNIGNSNVLEKDSTKNKKIKQKSSKDYTNININDINEKKEDIIIKKLKQNNLDKILSESDSCQEIDSMEEDSLSKGNIIKSSNMKLKNINNMNWDMINNLNFKKHLTSGFNNNNNLKDNKNSISSFTKKNTSKTAKVKKAKIMNINDNNEDEEEIIVNDKEFDDSRCIQNDKLNATKFPKLSTNPFIRNSINNNNDLYQKAISNEVNNNKLNNNQNKNENENGKNKEIDTNNNSNHHIISSTLGTIKQYSTNPNSSNLSNKIDIKNIKNNNTKNENENNEKINTNNKLKSNLNSNINKDILYRNLLLMAKKGDKEKFLENLEQIFSLANDLVNINYQDENGFSALHYACDEGNFKIVEILLKTNCDINIKNNEKKTPLHLSSKRGYFDISKKLIENGAILNIYDLEKNTPIHYVCMYNHIELLKYFLGKLPQADSKNIYGKMPIDLTTNKEIKVLLENYLKNNENTYHKITIYQTTDTKMKNLIDSYSGEGERNNSNNNINSSSLSRSPSKKSPKNKLRNRNKDFNSIQTNSNITKKNKINIDLTLSNIKNNDNNNQNNLNSTNIKIKHNNTLNNKSNLNSVIKKNDFKNNTKIKKNVNAMTSSKKLKKDIKKNKKLLIQDSNVNINNNVTSYNNNYNNTELKKTKTVEEFSTNNSNVYKVNLINSTNNGNKALNDSRINNSNYININNSINNGINRTNISFNTKNIENKKLNKTINRFDSEKKQNILKTDNKLKLLGINKKHKNLLLDTIEPNNIIINLNKTEENINNISKLSKISKTSLNKNKNITSHTNSKKVNNKDKNTIKIMEDKEKILSKSKNKSQNKNNKNNTNIKDNTNNNDNSYINNNININNCNTSKISCGPQTKNILDPINKSNILDKTLVDNLHTQLNLNSIEEERISPSSFICLAQLGKGSFGEVYLVQKINTQEKFAMKVLRKERIMGQNLLKYAITERNVLSLSNHPFIVKLNFAFQTRTKLFLILEYCPNGDLAKHLLFEKRFTEERAKFYICEILLALENLHQRDIIFRDLKPDNVVLDEEGNCKLTDFGLSKEGVNENSYAQSFCGSIAYLAPEMLKRQGHGKAVDWYLLGVLFYEMLVGTTPFYTNNKEEIFQNIEFGELKIPEFISKEASSLIRGLLQKDPNKRLGGSIKDAQEIKEHPYFKDVDWDKVYNKQITPPTFNNVTNKIMHVYQRPRLFANDDYLNKTLNKPYLNSFPGWSFINNEES